MPKFTLKISCKVSTGTQIIEIVLNNKPHTSLHDRILLWICIEQDMGAGIKRAGDQKEKEEQDTVNIYVLMDP